MPVEIDARELGLEVLSLDPEQGDVSIPWNDRVRAMTSPALLTVAIGKTPLESPVPMSRPRADGVVLEWAVEFTTTPLFFIDWMQTPRPSGLPDGGRVSSLTITTPAPDQPADVEGVSVHAGTWKVEASIDGIPLARCDSVHVRSTARHDQRSAIRSLRWAHPARAHTARSDRLP